MSILIQHPENNFELAEAHEINVTPFIDVMLVLLIVFMVAAPLATVDIHIDLPATNAKHQPRPDAPIFLTIKEDLSLVLGETPVSSKELTAEIDQATKGDKNTRLFLRANKTVSYENLMTVMNDLRVAGYLKIGLVGIEQSL
ncbi:MAG: TonB system transport protein ExbD [Pseudomonadales bacterium]|nr:TonB system transport protein ExbD [Pseudomonadales bacterium]